MGVDVNGGPHHVVGLTTWCRSAHHPHPSPPPVGATLRILSSFLGVQIYNLPYECIATFQCLSNNQDLNKYCWKNKSVAVYAFLINILNSIFICVNKNI